MEPYNEFFQRRSHHLSSCRWTFRYPKRRNSGKARATVRLTSGSFPRCGCHSLLGLLCESIVKAPLNDVHVPHVQSDVTSVFVPHAPVGGTPLQHLDNRNENGKCSVHGVFISTMMKSASPCCSCVEAVDNFSRNIDTCPIQCSSTRTQQKNTIFGHLVIHFAFVYSVIVWYVSRESYESNIKPRKTTISAP